MKRFVLAGALAFAAGSQALAADLPQPGPPPQAPVAYIPPIPPGYNWGGVYFGPNGGYGFGKSKWTTTSGVSTGSFDTSGYVAGGTLGFNFQADAFVVGLEGDIDATGIEGTSSFACMPLACETKNTWLSTFRARVGFAADRVLFYGTAGGAYGNVEAANVTGGFLSANKAGWTAGAGIEAAFTDNLTARLEYLYVDLENATFSSTVPSGSVTTTFNTSMIRFGVDYKFR